MKAKAILGKSILMVWFVCYYVYLNDSMVVFYFQINVKIKNKLVDNSSFSYTSFDLIRIPVATEDVKTGSDSSTAKRSAVCVSVTGPRRWPL